MENTKAPIKISSLQALRALAFLGIFLSHAGAPVEWAKLGVSVFFVLSGYLMTDNYREREMEISVKKNCLFAAGKIKKLYPLHILTMVCAALLALAVIWQNGIDRASVLTLAGNVAANLLLIQAWIPEAAVSLNSVAWYLSAALFFYFLFPWIIKGMKKISGGGKRSPWISGCILILATQLLGAFLIRFFTGESGTVYVWATYFLPAFRLGDFLFGCMIGMLKDEKKEISIKKGILLTAELLLLVCCIFLSYYGKKTYAGIFPSVILNYTTLYIPLAAGLIILFLCRGPIAGLLTNRALVALGNISAYAFLIHNVITVYVNNGIAFMGIELTGLLLWGKVAAEFALTVVFSLLYARIAGKGRMIG